MKIVKIGLPVVLILIVGLAVAWPSIAEYIVFLKVPQADRAEVIANYKAWNSKRITLPDAVAEAKPYGKDLQGAIQAFLEALKKYGKPAMNVAELELKADGANDLAAAEREAAALAPLMDAYAALVRRPDFTIGAIGVSMPGPDGRAVNPNLMTIQTCAKIMRLKARAEAKAGRTEEALRDAETIILASRVEDYESLVSRLLAVATCAIGARAWNEAVGACGDPAQLRRALASQNTLAGQLNLQVGRDDLQVIAQDNVGQLRAYKRLGVNVDYQNLTTREMTIKCCQVQAEYLESQVLPTLKNEPDKARNVKTQIASLEQTANLLGTKGLNGYLVGNFAAPQMYGISIPNFQETITRTNVAQAKFDLLRLATARKLYQIEKGKAPERDADLVPAYLPELPADRFAKEKTEYKAAGGLNYSIGPDGKDDGNQIVYDPSNGTKSAGDVALRKE